jgi:hypothetical protein
VRLGESCDIGEYCSCLGSALAREAVLSLILARARAEDRLRKLVPSVVSRLFDKPRLPQAAHQTGTTFELVRTLGRIEPDDGYGPRRVVPITASST